MKNANVIGSSVLRTDSPAKAAGKAKYTADYQMPGMLHVVLVRAKTAHAVLKGIQIPELPEGVYCFTAADLYSNVIPSVMNDQPVFASDVIRYYGEPVAEIAAPTLDLAKQIAAQVIIDTEELPIVEDVREALKEDAPKLFPSGNLCSDIHSLKGDLAEGKKNSVLILEDTYYLPVQSHGFLEPETAFSYYGEDGRLNLISSTQNAFADRTTASQVLNIPEEKIHSRAATVGGAFGGKDGNTSQIYAVMATYFTKKPARFAFSREENIRYGFKRHSAEVWVRMGFDANGILQLFEGETRMDTGAYALLGPAVLGLGVEHMTGPYYIPNIRLDGWLAYTNHTPASAMRGFGAPQTALAVECMMNQAAEQLHIDPFDLRERNAIQRGESGPMGAVMEYSTGFSDALELFRSSDFYREMQTNTDPTVSYGFAAGMNSCGMGKDVPDDATAVIERRGDGYLVRIGLVDIGQGSQTALGMIAADALKVPFEKIQIVMGDTDLAVNSGSTAASRTTYVCGNAILAAAKKLMDDPSLQSARALVSFPEIPNNDGVHSIFGFIVQGVKIRIDPLTGAVSILKAYNVTEAGHILHPDMMAGQIFGGMAMSIGYTLSEQVRYRNGKSMEDSFNSYVIPSALDAPHMINSNVPFYEESGPYGAKGIAEAATVSIGPAIAMAVHNFCPEISIHTLPIDRMEILRGLRKEQEK